MGKDRSPIEEWLSRWDLSPEGQHELAKGIFPEEDRLPEAKPISGEASETIYTESTNPFGD